MGKLIGGSGGETPIRSGQDRDRNGPVRLPKAVSIAVMLLNVSPRRSAGRQQPAGGKRSAPAGAAGLNLFLGHIRTAVFSPVATGGLFEEVFDLGVMAQGFVELGR